ncbi:MAG: AbgT family transporter [Vicinamibacteraceae bacterium]|nr:AbgT family transporter [Vicinamibacteraceae bacterium]
MPDAPRRTLSQPSPPSLVTRALALVERVGNALPHPATLFLLAALLVVLVSGLAGAMGLSVVHPATGERVAAVSLLTVDGLHLILTRMVTNFTSFAPLGTVLVAMLGIAVAEGSGLISAALKLLVLSAPRRLLTFAVVFAGIMSNTGGEVGYVLLLPLSALVFQAIGRHPIVGLAAAFAGVSGGYSANLLLGTIDPLLAGLTEEAAHIVDAAYRVNPACNYYFMAASTFVIAIAGTLVTEMVTAPRFGEWRGGSEASDIEPLTPAERRGLWFGAGAIALFSLVLLWGTVPGDGFLRDPETGDLLHSPFMTSIVSLIFFGGVFAGLAYGIGARTVGSDSDVVRAMSKSMETLGGYLVLVFFAAQFVAFFNWTNLGLIVAVEGAELLKASGLGTIPLTLAFVATAAAVNLTMGSASAKWAIMAPVFVPMFMLLGYTPEFTQAAYRVGDSVTNIISPMMSYFALIVAFVQRYDPKAGIGTLIATMLPYSVAFFAVWSLMLVAWILGGLPLGPGAEVFLPQPAE